MTLYFLIKKEWEIIHKSYLNIYPVYYSICSCGRVACCDNCDVFRGEGEKRFSHKLNVFRHREHDRYMVRIGGVGIFGYQRVRLFDSPTAKNEVHAV